MTDPNSTGIIRRAGPADAPRWLELLKGALGTEYVAREVYDPNWAVEQLSAQGEETWVAEIGDRLCASISILLPLTPNDNPVANLGRHLALPDYCPAEAVGALFRKIHDLCVQRRQMAIIRVPVSDQSQQVLLEKLGFRCVGFQPAKHLYRVQEGVLFYVRAGAPSPAIRLPLSQSLPQIAQLATVVLEELNIPNPEFVRDGATGYPVRSDLRFEESTPEAYEAVKLLAEHANPPIEISGQFNRGLGAFRVQGNAPIRVLLGWRDGRITAGLTYYFDEYDRCARLVDSFIGDDLSTGAILHEVVNRAQAQFKALYVEVDFLITAPRALKSAEQVGFVPVAYLPGVYKRGGCCVDLVKMVKLNTDYSLDETRLTSGARAVASIIDRNFQDQKVGLGTINLLRSLSAFDGLGDGELGKMARLFERRLYRANETVFQQGDSGDTAYIVVRGRVDILLPEKAAPVASLASGAIFGELAFLDGAPRTATAVAVEPSILLVIQRPAFSALVQTEPHLGMVMMRNMALELSGRLRKTDCALSAASKRAAG